MRLAARQLRPLQPAGSVNRADNISKALWQVISQDRKETSTKQNVTTKVNGRTLREPKYIADSFNNFFASAAKRALSDIIVLNNNGQIIYIRQPEKIDELSLYPAIIEVLNAIDFLEPKASASIDEILAKIAKSCKEDTH
ncbi:hypothetical protein J6590_059814 [Homalodisca vitripennis]|nr:hypothetical protein J6590_059814 [Homalodisca vitripennis]